MLKCNIYNKKEKTREIESLFEILKYNSFVFKLVYYNFSMLFTGDIEEVAEKSILKRYVNNKEFLC